MGHNSQIIRELRRSFSKVAAPDGGQGAKAYMRNQFDFFGVQTPIRRDITRDLMKQSKEFAERELIDLCKELWAQREREFQYVACDLLVKNAKRLSPNFVKRDAKWFITNKSWWDSVDSVRKAIEVVVAANPELEEVTDKWIESSNIWLVRSALIHQLTLGNKTNSERLFRYCEVQATEKEFFIAKGLGWALRSYSYTDPKAVTMFVQNHPELTPLAKREGLKRISH